MPHRRFLPILLLCALLAVLVSGWLRQGGAGAAALDAARVQDFRAHDGGLSFTLVTPPVRVAANGSPAVAGLNHTAAQPGAPALPVYATYLAVPAGATVSVQVEASMPLRRTGIFVPPAPRFEVGDADPVAALTEAGQRRMVQALNTPIIEADPAIYGQSRPYPDDTFALSAPVYYRDWQLVRLTLHPVRYAPATQQLLQDRQLRVSVTFNGGQAAALPLPDQTASSSLASLVLNYQQGLSFRHLPQAVRSAPATALPLGIDTLKIEVVADGIYQVTGADMAAAGWDIAAVDPATIQMLSQGEPVAYQLVHDGDGVLEPGEAVRFFGHAFRGSRLQTQFVTRNVYWLWAGGTPAVISSAPNLAGQGQPVVTSFPESVTVEGPEQYHFHTRTNLWAQFPNEPDAWYMDYFQKGSQAVLTRTYAITLPDPAPAGPPATVTVELMTRDTPVINDVFQTHEGRVRLNGDPNYGQHSWGPKENVNVTVTVPQTAVQAGANTVYFASSTNSTSTARERLYTNRVTVDYTRQLRAVNDQLLFAGGVTGTHQFNVQAFTQPDPAQVLVWDVSAPRQPVAISMNGHIVAAGGGSYTYQVGRAHGGGARFIATTLANLRAPAAISTYRPPALDPAGGAAWLAISHADFMTEAVQLAAHRADPAFTGLAAHVVDVADVINQYGYGLPTPEAIRAFLTHALGQWDTPPAYVLLLGDATFNPLHYPCASGCADGFDPQEPVYVVTDLVFEDPYQGLIPTDHTMALLSGPDLVADVAIGRIPAQTAAEAAAAVAKIILYEQQQLSPAGRAYHRRVLFVADNADEAGDFCYENDQVGQVIPGDLTQTHLCLPDDTPAAADALRDQMRQQVSNGVALFNYRGHGSPWSWAQGSNLLSIDTADFWLNFNRPTAIVSADCLDGYFTYPGNPGMGETFLKLGSPALNIGTMAHWSSTGLGTTFEHTALMNGFYSGLFDHGLSAIGDAAGFAKLAYYQLAYEEAELYSFTLQGDPAMPLFRPELALSMRGRPARAMPGEVVTFTLQVTNSAFFPARLAIQDTLPVDLQPEQVTASGPVTDTVSGNQWTVYLSDPLPESAGAVVTLTARIAPAATAGARVNVAALLTPAQDLNPADNQDSVTVVVFLEDFPVFLPAIRQP